MAVNVVDKWFHPLSSTLHYHQCHLENPHIFWSLEKIPASKKLCYSCLPMVILMNCGEWWTQLLRMYHIVSQKAVENRRCSGRLVSERTEKWKSSCTWAWSFNVTETIPGITMRWQGKQTEARQRSGASLRDYSRKLSKWGWRCFRPSSNQYYTQRK